MRVAIWSNRILEFSIPLGTLEVATYLRDVSRAQWDNPTAQMPMINTYGPDCRYGAILFVEKEGFNEIFEAIQLAERYDIAIMSTKGTSVTAARHLVDELCASHEIPLFGPHDFDKSGLTILKTWRNDTKRYTFMNKIKVTDLGLRLDDVEAERLEGEAVSYKSETNVVRDNLRESGASEDEIAFLLRQRVELHAFTADGLVAWVERKLTENGIRKIIPNSDKLGEAYRREKQSVFLQPRFQDLLKESEEFAKGVSLGRLDVGLEAENIEVRDEPVAEFHRFGPWIVGIARVGRNSPKHIPMYGKA